MAEQEYNEPWVSDNGHITDAEGGYIGYLTDFIAPEDERIIVCINACAGIPTVDLLKMELKRQCEPIILMNVEDE